MIRELTPEEHLTNAETMRHILTVRALLMEAIREMVNRADAHDLSKLSDPEVSSFAIYTAKLANMTYGSDEYKAAMNAMRPAIDHHQSHNRHHPEFHKDGIMGMDLFDVIEMLLDWKAATLRHKDGSINRSLEVNTERFKIPEPLRQIMVNTLPKIEEMATRSRVAISYPHV